MSTPLDRLQIPALIAGAIALVAAIVGGLGHADLFFRGYLVGFLFCVSIPLGALGLLLLQYLTGGAWGIAIRGVTEAAVRTLWLTALMFIPIVVGIHSIFIWSHEDHVQADPILQHKAAYLNSGFFTGRGIFYFAVWLVVGWLLLKWGREFERSGDPKVALNLRHLGGGGLLLLALTVTFSAIDWAMSLDPHWFSTIWGMSFMVGHMLAGMTFSILVLVAVSRTEPVASFLRPSHLRDLGNLTLAFTMLWAYMSFSQFLLIWYGNLQEEVTWYIPRMHGGWGFISSLLIVFHFFLPFFLLLMRQIKDRPATLRVVAAMLLLMHFIDLLWIVVPTLAEVASHGGGGDHAVPHFGWLDVVPGIGLFGIWFGVFVMSLRKGDLLPARESAELMEAEAVSHG
jgi:hypothetical protein